jgi:lipopolysaccharide export system protein LptC
MLKARYRGTDRKNQPYLITADTATQQTDASKVIALDRVAGDLTSADGTWMTLNAKTGLFDQTGQTLWLQGDVNVWSDKGYEFHGLTADVNMKEGTLASDDKVWGHGPLGELRANGMRVFEKGDRIVFIKGVTTTLYPQAKAAVAKPAAAPAPAAKARP